MRLTRIYVEQTLIPGNEVGLSEQAGLHLTRVLRLEAGAPVTLFDGTGGEYEGTLERDGKKIRARVGAHSAIERESPLLVTLIQGVARGERMDLIVQKATELGVTRIVPVFAQRSVVKVDASKGARKLEHWRSIAISACEQCGRNRVPEVAEPVALGDAVRSLEPGCARYLLAAGASETLATAVRRDAGKPVVLMIGPEGGLADAERNFADAHGFTACAMGPRILRTETAGLAALAIMQTVAGDFR
jgi:16S rRNA (uracil1498-N3)-methyltransferase